MLEQYAIVPSVAQVQCSTHQEVPAPVLALTEHEEPAEHSRAYGVKFARFLDPLLRTLDTTVDKRPLRTLVQAVEAILAFRDQRHGLLLSELGGYLDQLGAGGGGTKRLGTLIHHRKWQAAQLEEFLLTRADHSLAQWETQGQEGLLIWDATVLEKPESLTADGLCAVRSSKAARLTHVKQGYYHPPGTPICVPGLHGIGLLLAGRSVQQGPPCWPACDGGPRVALWLVTRRMKAANSCASRHADGEGVCFMCLIEAIVVARGWEPYAASKRVLSCAGKLTLI